MEFKQREDGSYFPPVLPNSEFWAVAFGSKTRQMLFVVNDAGLYAEGLFYLWEEITGSSIAGDNVFNILSDKYRNGGLRFYEGTALVRDASGKLIHRIDGYSVDYCLLNRICFESNRKA